VSDTRGPTGIARGPNGGAISDLVGKTPLIGTILKPLLQKIGLGVKDCNKIMNGDCVCMRKYGKGLYMRPYGGGLFIGPQGSGSP
jgi:hypothetical protein